jgi:hypothetical protein
MPDINYEWLLELKYLRKSDKDKLETVKEEGLQQLEEYAASRNVAAKKDIKQVLIIFIGKDEYILEIVK